MSTDPQTGPRDGSEDARLPAYVFFKTDDCRSTKYFTLESCANDEAAIRHGQGLLRAGAYSAIDS